MTETTNKNRQARNHQPKGRTSWLFGGAAIAVTAVVVVLGVVFSRPAPLQVQQFTHIHGLAAPAWADGDVFISTHFGLIRINGEGQWHEVGTVKHDFMGFQAHPTEANVLYSSGHPGQGSNLPNPIGFMVSRDAGLSWQTLALAGEADFHAMAVQQGNGEVIYGFNVAVNPGLYRSFDGGQNWEQVESAALIQLGGANALAIHPENPDVILAGTRAGLLYSADGGETWQGLALEGVTVTAIAFSPESSERILAYGAHPEVGLVLSEDGGASWTRLGVVLENNDAVGYIAVHPERAEEIYLGSYGQNLYKTLDGGASWQPLALNGVPQRQ